MWIAGILLGGFFSGIICWVFFQNKQRHLLVRLAIAEEQNKRIAILETSLSEKESENASLRVLCATAEEKLAQSKESQTKVEDTFKAFCWEALEKNNRNFLDLAKTTLEKYQDSAKGELEKRHQSIVELVNPVREVLQKLDQDIKSIEKERKGEQEVIKEQLKSLVETERLLRQETSSLVKALKTPTARGRWGEVQLKRVVEIAGMLNHCDFYEQKTFEGEEGKLRPDLIVKLPGGRQVVVDAKVPLDAYLDSMHMNDEKEKESKLKEHARQVRSHLTSLSKKNYWDYLQPTPEFVVLFLPSETFFSAALEYDPSLLEAGAVQKVIIATPTTLIALLKAVSYGWKEENLSRHVEQVSLLAQEMYKRLVDIGGAWSKMGKSLSQAVESYNKAVGSLESRVLVTARKFKDLGVVSSQADFETVDLIEKQPRLLQAPEFCEDNLS
jgi:DNA recombination protein RmuC